jgi:hypothetical protein
MINVEKKKLWSFSVTSFSVRNIYSQNHRNNIAELRTHFSISCEMFNNVQQQDNRINITTAVIHITEQKHYFRIHHKTNCISQNFFYTLLSLSVLKHKHFSKVRLASVIRWKYTT